MKFCTDEEVRSSAIMDKMRELQHEIVKQYGPKCELVNIGINNECYDALAYDLHKAMRISASPSSMANIQLLGVRVKLGEK